ncbi:hypothetical protein SAMN05444372_1047 [Flavobacterium micromati]|uniref:Uncharacterized protein n=1 Tax=Flavobacterium micromati TaxID=229205 RepID=A0A1M5IB85_9FLAO|nr:hypothetical protein SAMN05444372_1047 [Flavobacterium micromati]
MNGFLRLNIFKTYSSGIKRCQKGSSVISSKGNSILGF